MQEFKADNIDQYIALFSPEVQKRLSEIREMVHEQVPGVEETIKYNMPTFFLQGNLLHFAAYKNHIAMYPAPGGDSALAKEIEPYIKGKSTLQFPLKNDLPYDLIRKIIIALVRDHKSRHQIKNQVS
ncbi:MAG: DUF1801 domain-containing protein [Saprospiraceae bacterium]|nr:DUF1801 domain-containing protein [candidate division KSB1 bacterium]MCB0664312.1 DUF1801 domain-containing protein [Saprospiraceae bacterium]